MTVVRNYSFFDVFFKPIPSVLTIIGNVQDKKFAAGIMNLTVLVNTYIKKSDKPLQPFLKEYTFDWSELNGDDLKDQLKAAYVKLKAHQDQILRTSDTRIFSPLLYRLIVRFNAVFRCSSS